MRTAVISLVALASVAQECYGFTAPMLPGRVAPLRTRPEAVSMSMQTGSSDRDADGSLGRRSLLFGMAAAPVLLAGQKSALAEVVSDDSRGYSFTVPEGWVYKEASFPGANKNPSVPIIQTYIKPDNTAVNVAVVSYAIRPDYEKLGSMGSIDDVAKTVLGKTKFGNDGSVDSEMIGQKEGKAGGTPAYIFDYRIKDKRLKTVFAVEKGAFSGTWLVTMTAQAPVSLYKENEATIEALIKSFTLEKRD